MTRNETRNGQRFAARLKEAQAVRGFTNEAAARGIGVSLRLYQHWRAGNLPSTGNLFRLADFYSVPVGWFLDDEKAAA